MRAGKKLSEAAVDSSAVMSIFDNRSSAPAFKAALKRSEALYMSAGTLVELSQLIIGRKGPSGPPVLDSFLANYRIEIVPVDLAAIEHARYGFIHYGKGLNKAADLNYGDLFSYALAKSRGMPLYFEGKDFPNTDIAEAMVLLGYSFDKDHKPIPILEMGL